MNVETLLDLPKTTPIAACPIRISSRIRRVALLVLAGGFLASSSFAGQLTLTWSDNSDNEDGFKIERSSDGETFAEIGTVGADIATYLDTTVTDNQEYVYRVRAFNQFGDSGYSNTATGLVENGNEGPVESAPIIVTHPLGIEESIGGPTGFSVEAIGYPEPSYQWLFNGEPIEGATESEYLIDAVTRESEGSYSVIVANDRGNATSEEAYLTAVSQIQIVSAPVNVTIEGEDQATLSVNADGPNLEFQWFKGKSGDRSNPIGGATSNTYVTDLLSATADYWVEISVGGISQGNDTYLSDTTTVIFEPISHYYFGTIGPGSNGSFALMDRGDGTGVLMAKIDSLGLVLESSDISIYENGYFEYAEGESIVLSGSFEGSAVSGSVNGTDLTFEATRAPKDGSTKAFAGFYYAVLPNTSDGQVLSIVGPNGESYVSVGLGADSDAGPASIDGAGTLTADISEVYAMALSLNDEYASLVGSILVGESNYAVDGQREDIDTKKILFNTSIRGQVKAGASTMIAGFVVSGTGAKKVLIRGIGPSLLERGVSNAVGDPRITLYKMGESGSIGSNDDWGQAPNASDISIAAQLVGATPLGSATQDAAMLVELTSGVYTAHITNDKNMEGTALVEVFDVSEAEGAETNSQLANISMRGDVSTGNDVIIAGFVVSGDAPKRVLVRAMGPELTGLGVSGALVDPRLTIYQYTNEGNVEIATNEDWHEEEETVAAAAAQSGAFAFDEGSSSAAKVIWLDPGLYTAVASSADSSSGNALVEVYEVE